MQACISLTPWNRYYNRLMLEKEYSIDQNEIANYFPLTQTINGMLKIFEELFGLEFVERVPIEIHAHECDRHYLEVKASKMGHIFETALSA